jgi:hypothetical protein
VVLIWRHQFSKDLRMDRRYSVEVSVKIDLQPAKNQMIAIAKSSINPVVFGDIPENHGKGYSFKRTVLGHASEIDPSNEKYFVLSVAKMSLKPEVIDGYAISEASSSSITSNRPLIIDPLQNSPPVSASSKDHQAQESPMLVLLLL